MTWHGGGTWKRPTRGLTDGLQRIWDVAGPILTAGLLAASLLGLGMVWWLAVPASIVVAVALARLEGGDDTGWDAERGVLRVRGPESRNRWIEIHPAEIRGMELVQGHHLQVNVNLLLARPPWAIRIHLESNRALVRTLVASVGPDCRISPWLQRRLDGDVDRG